MVKLFLILGCVTLAAVLLAALHQLSKLLCGATQDAREATRE